MAKVMAGQETVLKNQVFSLAAPNAKTVLVAGDFTNWQAKAIPMKKGSTGVWTTTVKLPAGKHPYLFLVDGQWHDDPECQVRLPNPYGGQNMVRLVA